MNVMDIETYNDIDGKITPYCICLLIDNKKIVIWDVVDPIIELLEKISENCSLNTTVFAHNINFDGLIVIDELKTKSIFFDVFIRNHNLYWIKIKYLNSEIVIRCSYKIIAMSVKKMGDMLNFKKLSFPYKFVNKDNLSYIGEIPEKKYFNDDSDYYNFIESNSYFNLKEVSIKYCIRDVEIVQKVLLELFSIISHYSSLKVINNTYSFSSISYKIYVKKYDRWGVNYFKNNLFTHNYIKNAYYGGQVNVFGNPNGKIVHHFDYSGMYGQCMMQKFPIGVSKFSINDLDYNKIGFHIVRVKVDDYLPFLPYKSDKLLFPNGEFVGCFWYEEIINAVNNKKCTVLKHYSSLLYDQEDYIFNDYIKIFTEIRDRGGYYKIFGKNMINGLYGSFALNDDDGIYHICFNESEFNSYIKLVDIFGWKKIGNFYIININLTKKSKNVLDKKNSWDLEYKKRNLAYAAIISSKARIKLNNALQTVLNDGGELYYTDTDSIFAGYDDNRLGKKIGDITWSDVYKDAVFISNKFYFLKDFNLKLKGINHSSYSFDDIKSRFYNNENMLTFKNQQYYERKNLELFYKVMNKNVSINAYDKRVFSKDKKSTFPVKIIQTW